VFHLFFEVLGFWFAKFLLDPRRIVLQAQPICL
jgi:hypothetical protein